MMLKSSVVKANLTRELALLLKNTAADHSSHHTLSSELVQSLCCIIEAVFIHGLKKAFYGKVPRNAKYPEPNFWPFISKNSERMILKQIESSHRIKTEIGKCRAWIRVALNNGLLEHYLDLFSHNAPSISKFYENFSFLRDSEQMNILVGYLKGLAKYSITAPINSSLLNSWTPSPLILSGIMSGKPTRLEELRKLRERGLSLESLQAEKAESAVECLEESVYDSSSSNDMDFYGTCDIVQDDGSSVYSHPSMLDGGWKLSRTDLAGSGLLTNTICEDGEHDPHRVHVVRRAHRHKTKSSKGSSDGDSSNTASVASLPSTSGKHGLTFDGEMSQGEQQVVHEGENKEAVLSHGSHSQPNFSIEQHHTSNERKMKAAEVSDITMDAGRSIDSGVVASELPNSFDDKPQETSSETEVLSTESPTKSGSNSTVVVPVKWAEAVQHTVLIVQNFSETEKSVDVPKKEENIVEEMQAISLQDELLLAEGLAGGNSLLGKGWIESSQIVASIGDGRAHYSSTSSDSYVFDNEMQSVMDKIFDKDTMLEETDSGAFANEITTLMCEDARRNSAGGSGCSTSSKKSAIDVYSGLYRGPLNLETVKSIMTSIPREKGLDAQDFRCPSCRKSIGPTFAKYKVCGFDGLCYCERCWKNEECVIPSRLVHNWDTKPRPVCWPNMLLIERLRDKAVIRIDQINPHLYKFCPPMKTIMLLREKLSLTVLYLLSCRKSVVNDLQQRIWPKDYLYKDIHLYSFADLLTVLSGHLELHLNNLIAYTINHIHACALCSQKGFICEICSSRQVIYPFQIEITFRCSECYSVYHKNCIGKKRCPKCVRREKYLQNPKIGDDHLLLD